MDMRVLEAQQWYNATYSGRTGYVAIAEDGITGGGTCKALVRALQIELGLTVDGSMGAGTVAACPTISADTTNTNLIKIVQCGFYCKGYECGGIDGIYSEATASAAYDFVTDVGFPNATGTLSGKLVQALLNTDPFKLISSGSSNVRSAQQYLNREYLIYMSAFKFIPCTGVPDRNMMKAIIAALQYEEAGHSMSGVDGIYGNNTLNKAPTLSVGTTKSAYVKIARMCMMCMYSRGVGLSGDYGTDFETMVAAFQRFYGLEGLSGVTSGEIGKTTWASLLSSKGDTSRAAKACDTSTQILTDAKAEALVNAGYEIVGRYLTGTVGGTRDKSLSVEELLLLKKHGLRVFPIYQDGGASASYFSYEQGRIDADLAIEAALDLAIPENTIIYFAVDFDFTEDQVRDKIVDHFTGIKEIFYQKSANYRIGIYGARNTCSIICDKDLACSSFVSDMSTGYSGNLGFPLPDNWAFDQFYEYTQSAADGSFAVDKNAYSERDRGFSDLSCAGISEKDVTKHVMRLQSDGYYVCPVCGYRVKSPYIQDSTVLDYDDYMKVLGLECMYSFLIASNYYNVYFYDFMYKIHEVRSQDKYEGKYEYVDDTGKCAMIIPEASHTGVQSQYNQIKGPVVYSKENEGLYNGLLDSLIDTATDIVCGFIIPTTYKEEFAIAVLEYLNEEATEAETFFDCLMAVATKEKANDWIVALNLLQFAINAVKSTEVARFEYGDIIVEYEIVLNAMTTGSLYAIFSSNHEFKGCLLNDGTVPE